MSSFKNNDFKEKAKQDAQYVKSFQKYSGRPDYEAFNGSLNAQPALDYSADIDQIKNMYSGVDPRGAGFDAYQQEALRTGPSNWANLMMQRLDVVKDAQADELARASQGQLAGITDQLATKGGVSGGSRERLAQSIGRDSMRERQNIMRASELDKLGILSTDEQNRMNALNNFVGMEQSANAMDMNKAGAFGNLLQTQSGIDMANRDYLSGIEKYNLDSARQEHQFGFQDRQNSFNQAMENLRAWEQSKATKAACFVAGSKILMKDGNEKPVEEIELGDEMMDGGEVYCVMKGKFDKNDTVYDYKGVKITGGHLVLEDGAWIRVYDSKIAKPTEEKPKFVYNFINEHHTIIANDVYFADYEEVDIDATENYYTSMRNKFENQKTNKGHFKREYI